MTAVDRETGEITSTALVPVHAAEAIARGDITPQMVTQALRESCAWLALACDSTDPARIADFKAWAATVEEATKQKKLGRKAELDAAEMVRRAERGIGVAIRNGQEAGEIRKPGDNVVHRGDVGRGGHLKSAAELVGAKSRQEVQSKYGVLAGSVDDEEFDKAVTEAKSEGDLSHANVVRKVKGQKNGVETRSQRADRIREKTGQRRGTLQVFGRGDIWSVPATLRE